MGIHNTLLACASGCNPCTHRGGSDGVADATRSRRLTNVAADKHFSDAAWAAERVYNALDAFLQDQGFEVGSPDAEAALLGHPLVQAELQRQADDLVALRAIHASDVPPAAVESLRNRADAAAEHIFG